MKLMKDHLRILLVSVFVLLLLVGALIQIKASSRSTQNSRTSPPEEAKKINTPFGSPTHSENHESFSNGLDSQNTKKPTESYNKPLTLPSLEHYRQEVLIDPHTPSETLVQFARDLGERMETAKNSENYATELMKDLEKLIISHQHKTPVAAQALGLKNAKTLAEKYPRLKPILESIMSHADPLIIKLAHD